MKEHSAIGSTNLSWVFGYGSLMWNPGFPFLEQHSAELIGYHRAFCMYSQHHRGTKEYPGLVLGLDQGGRCLGMAFRVAKSDWLQTITYLDKRELVSNYAYIPTTLEVNLSSRRVSAYTYIANPEHPNYAGKLPLETVVKIIRNAKGIGGYNKNYLVEVIRKLNLLGCADESLNTILRQVKKTAENS